MWKLYTTLIGISIFLLTSNPLYAQKRKRKKDKAKRIEMIEPVLIATDTTAFIPEDTTFIVEYIDTLEIDLSGTVDENIDDIFSEKMDSMVHSSYIRELFHFDYSEDDTSVFFPQNIPDSVYISRLQKIQEVIPLSFNNTVKNVIKFYTEKRRDQVEMMLGLSAYYFPIFEEALDRNNMPLELKYMPVIESALNPKALSRVGANGLWQFMYGTGKQMGLEITSFVDERRDPVKSTEAAIRYLKYLHNLYDDWYLAIAAYNCGPGNVNRAIVRSGNKRNYWDIYYRLPRETRGYVPAFIAAAYVMNYYRDHNLFPQMPEIPFQTDTLVINDYLHFEQISESLDVDKELIRSLNPMYRRDVIPAKDDKSYTLVLPQQHILDFVAKDSEIFAYNRDKYFPDNSLANIASSSSVAYDIAGKARVSYTIKTGDNLGFIATWFKVRLSDLRHWNNIRGNLIRAGQRLTIYVPEAHQQYFEKFNTMTFAQKQSTVGKTPVASAVSASTSTASGYEIYTVRKGDTIWGIANRFAGVTPQEILRLNNLSKNSKIAIGQKLKIRPSQDS